MKQKKVIAITSIALDSDLKGLYERLARLEGTSLGKMFKDAMAFYLGFSKEFLDMARKIASDLDVSTSFVVRRLALSYLAKMAAKEIVDIETYGEPLPRVSTEFISRQTDMEFFEARKDEEVKEIQSINKLKQDLASFYSGETKPQIME